MGRELAEAGHRLDAVEAFEVAGGLQGVVNAAEGGQAVAGALGARVETTMREPGPWERVTRSGSWSGLDVARAVLDADTDTLASHTSAAYRPPAAMQTAFVTTRDGTCRMCGCSRRAEHTDLDHTRPWPEGPITPTNLAGLCRRHHRMKQHGRWRSTMTPDGTITWTTITWTSTTGRTHHRARTPTAPLARARSPPVTVNSGSSDGHLCEHRSGGPPTRSRRSPWM